MLIRVVNIIFRNIDEKAPLSPESRELQMEFVLKLIELIEPLSLLDLNGQAIEMKVQDHFSDPNWQCVLVLEQKINDRLPFYHGAELLHLKELSSILRDAMSRGVSGQ
ncbi:hypothetical protein [Pedobacter psychroterrae]|uniref:Uncharacterized protein n=1 Tax=Pedobacter psychroterrae TaxID=2530453 RepID=A0A4R0NQ75_9SPHI|nr:hypothetical protein [Pedobacter psychroterrae]TCD03190.1 hypothetical protein EZ437_04240 [Pedobacter psychroterrae]